MSHRIRQLPQFFSNKFVNVDIISSEQFLDIPAGESLAGYVLFQRSDGPAIHREYVQHRRILAGAGPG